MDIKKVGSLDPERKIQDTVLVYNGGGYISNHKIA